MTDRFKNKYRIPTARAAWHDYKGGSYFVTICTKEREPYFGHIVDGEMKYTDLGLSANDCLQAIPSHFPDAEIPEWIVMPNHIHAIIIINAPAPIVETQNLASHIKQTAPAYHIKQTTHYVETQNLASHIKQKTNHQRRKILRLYREKPYKNLAHNPKIWHQSFGDSKSVSPNMPTNKTFLLHGNHVFTTTSFATNMK